MSFCDSYLLMRAMSEAGVPVTHLSRVTHGVPGGSRLGIAAASRFYRAAENRHLQARVVMHDATSPSYFKQLGELLATNHAVTIRGDVGLTSSSQRAPCLGVEFKLASGAPRLAFRSSAPLLTACAKRLGPFHYQVVIQGAVDADRSRKKSFVSQAVTEYSRRLDQQLLENSPDWQGWRVIERLVASSETKQNRDGHRTGS